MKNTLKIIGMILILTLLSIANLQAEIRWKNISKISKQGKIQKILDAKAFNGKCYVLYIDGKRHNYKVSKDKGEYWNNLHRGPEDNITGGSYAGQIINEKYAIYFLFGMKEKYFMKTADGGDHWYKVPIKGTIDNEPINNEKVKMFYIQMCDTKIGLAHGRYDNDLTIYTTEDGWENMKGRKVEYLNKIEGISDQVSCDYYVRLGKDTIVKSGYYLTPEKELKIAISYSYDKGETYTKHDTLSEIFYTIIPMQQSNPIKKTTAGFWTLSGGKVTPETDLNGRVYKCKNLGDKWEEIFFNEDYTPIENCDFYDENRGVITGIYGEKTPFSTDDGGKTWKSDTLFTSEAQLEYGMNANVVVYVGDTALIIGGNGCGNVYRLENVESKEYDVDTLQQIKLVAKEDKFNQKTIKFVAFADKEEENECWIDLNNNKKREENEKIKVQPLQFYPKINERYVENKEVTIYGKIAGLWVEKSGMGELQINKCPRLEDIFVEDNPINDIDIKNSPILSNLTLKNCKSITTLDLSENSSLKYLKMWDVPLNDLYLPKDNNIIQFILEKSKIKELDLTGFKDTVKVYLTENTKLKKIKIDDNSNILQFTMSECNDETSTMDLSGLKNARYISVNQTGFSELDLSQCKKTENIVVQYNPELKKIILPQHDSLMTVEISNNYISEMHYKASPNTVIFNCNDNAGIESLDFTGNTGLILVDCFRNKITGDEADKLMESLPDRTGKKQKGQIRFTANNSKGKYKVGNWAYAYSVEKAKAKNWSIQYYPQGDYKGTSSVSEGTLKVFNIYPNPADNVLNIPEYETLITDIEIYNTSLDQVKTLTPAAKIDISELPAGVYYIKLNFVMHKFVKK